MKISISLILKKIQELKNQILAKTPHEKWIFACDFTSFFYRGIFCPITDPNYKVRCNCFFFALVYIGLIAVTVNMLCTNTDELLIHILGCYSLGPTTVVSSIIYV